MPLLRRLLRGSRRLVAGPSKTDAATKPPAWRLLVESGLFDAEFYAAQTGRQFKSPEAAARHLVKVGHRRGYSPHPLISMGTLPGHVTTAWRSGSLSAVLDYLRKDGLDKPWSPLFDPSTLLGPLDGQALEPGERWGIVEAFVALLTPETRLPLAYAPEHRQVTWGEARSTMVASATRVATQAGLTRSRTTAEWDADAEAAWLADVSASPLPPVGAPTVSVIMPVWNRGARVTDAVRSIQAQTFQDWELVVVDDGSTDDTLAVLRQLASSDPRIRVVANEHSGVCASRNSALEIARGDYVAFLDSDNQWRPHFLDSMLRAMHRDGIRAGYSGTRLLRGDDTVTYRAYRGDIDHLLVLNHIDLNVLVVEREIAREVGPFDTALRRWVDHDYAIRVARLTTPQCLPFIGCDYDDDDASSDDVRITTSESDHWQFAVLGKALVNWDELRETADQRTSGRVSVVIPTYQDSRMTGHAVDAVLSTCAGADVEVIVVDNGSSAQVSLALSAMFAGIDRVRLVRTPRNLNFAIGSNIGVRESTGELILFLNNDTVTRDGWLAPLVERLRQGDVVGVQPLLLYPDDTIQAAGTVFPADDALPVHLLAHSPREDAAKVAPLEFSAVTAAATLYDARTVIALKGFDPIYVNGMEDVDLCLRATELTGRRFAVATTSVIEHHESKTPGRGANIRENRRIFMARWRGRLPKAQGHLYDAVGLQVVAMDLDAPPYAAPRPVVIRTPLPGSVDLGGGHLVPRLRWSIKNSANAGPRGDAWGDTHFCEALAAGLRKVGQEAVVMRHGAHHGPASAFDDVALVVRGLDVASPQPGRLNILWVISHPDEVSAEEIAGFDLVFAASHTWAARMTAATGTQVRVLHQATDPRVFHPEGGAGRTDDVVFVGQARHDHPRAIVMDAIRAGLEPKVWGTRWEPYIPASLHQGTYFPNEQLGDLYRGAGVVLNDHWTDMARDGFIANRIFDAVASGARVVSDPVTGISELFDGAVLEYSSPEDLVALASPTGLAAAFPDDSTRIALAHRVGAEHSFEARALTLVEAVHALRRDRASEPTT